MSDGTLRALGILDALFQLGNNRMPRVPLVGIEEPEVALHPAATAVLLDSLRDASGNTQILVTSHSPDLLDDERVKSASILAVIAEQGVTHIGPLDAAGRSALRDNLYTAGELLRIGQMSPDMAAARSASGRQLRLFDESHP
jgi:predicted ATPase